MLKRLLSIILVTTLSFSLASCTQTDEQDVTPAPELLMGTEAWDVDASLIDLSEVTQEFKDEKANPTTLVDAALGVLGVSFLEGTDLYYEGWTEEDFVAHYNALKPFLSPQLTEEMDEVFREELMGPESITLPLLAHVPSTGLLVNYDLVEYHTSRDKPVKFFIPQDSVITYVDAAEKREHKLAAVEVTLIGIIDTIEGEQFGFENRIVLQMIPVENTWVLDAVRWYGDPDDIIPDKFKVSLEEAEGLIDEALKEDESTVIVD